jgi:hypothetical protein
LIQIKSREQGEPYAALEQLGVGPMEISTRDLWTVLHGMGFGALFMLAFSGA